MVREKKDKAAASAESEPQQDNDVNLDKIEAMFSRLLGIVNDSFTATIERVIGTIERGVQIKLDAQASELFNMSKALDEKTKSLSILTKEHDELKTEMNKLRTALNDSKRRTDDLEQYSYADNILIHGITTENDDADLENKVISIVNANLQGINATTADISVVHRIKTATPNNKPAPVVIRFTRRSVRNRILQNRKQLKGKSVSITEHLSPSRNDLLKKATQLVHEHKVSATWSQGGRILVKKNNNEILQINSAQQLSTLQV